MDEAKYREAERHLWESVGLTPREHRIRIKGSSVRVQEVGSGEPVVFIHGAPNAGSTWAGMLEHFHGFRSLLVDRPGTGLSDPYPLNLANVHGFAKDFVGNVLTELGIERAHVVASSFGGYIGLRSASEYPGRIARMVQMACPGFVPGFQTTAFMRLMSVGAVRRILNVLPPNEKVSRSIIRQIGHGASLDAGIIPQGFFDWYLALQKYTDTMRNDGEAIGFGATFFGWNKDLMLADDFFTGIETPTLFLWGEDDAFGGRDVAEHVVSLMPKAELHMIAHSGHLPWLDIPRDAAAATAAFIAG